MFCVLTCTDTNTSPWSQKAPWCYPSWCLAQGCSPQAVQMTGHLNKLLESWERVKTTDQREEELRRKLLTWEKSKTTFMISGAKGERRHAVCWEQSGASRRKNGGRPQVKADPGPALPSGPHTGHCTGTHAHDGGSGGGPTPLSRSVGAEHTGSSKLSGSGWKFSSVAYVMKLWTSGLIFSSFIFLICQIDIRGIYTL